MGVDEVVDQMVADEMGSRGNGMTPFVFAEIRKFLSLNNQSRTNGPINAHLTIAQV